MDFTLQRIDIKSLKTHVSKHCQTRAWGQEWASRYPQGRCGGKPSQKRRVEQQEPAPSQWDVLLRAGFLFLL